MACAVDELYISNIGTYSDEQIKTLYDDAISGQDLSKVLIPDEGGLTWLDKGGTGVTYYQFNGNMLDSTVNNKDGIFKENTTNIGVANYGLAGDRDWEKYFT